MNRAIKFRVWDKEFSNWFNSYNEERGWSGVPYSIHVKGICNFSLDITDHLVYQQFTGLSDKNNKEIYEGDIVNYNNENFEVRIGSIATPSFGTIVNCTYLYKNYRCINEILQFNLNVVGNIFENPELL